MLYIKCFSAFFAVRYQHLDVFISVNAQWMFAALYISPKLLFIFLSSALNLLARSRFSHMVLCCVRPSTQTPGARFCCATQKMALLWLEIVESSARRRNIRCLNAWVIADKSTIYTALQTPLTVLRIRYLKYCGRMYMKKCCTTG